MARCLTVQRHNLNQSLFSLESFVGILSGAISQQVLKPPLCIMISIFIPLKLLPHLQTNMLKHVILSTHYHFNTCSKKVNEHRSTCITYITQAHLLVSLVLLFISDTSVHSWAARKILLRDHQYTMDPLHSMDYASETTRVAVWYKQWIEKCVVSWSLVSRVEQR